MKRIGIPTALYGNYFGTHKYYINWVAQFGQPVLLTPYDTRFNENIDVFFLPGGSDVASGYTYLTDRSNPHLEWFDEAILHNIGSLKKPIFAVCRGMQAVNLAFNGTLKNLYAGDLDIHQHNKDEEDKNKRVHYITVVHKDFADKDAFMNEFKVNSIHHQIIDKLGNGLEVIAKSDEIIEAIRHKTLPIAGVQWHPEKINDEIAVKLFKSIL